MLGTFGFVTLYNGIKWKVNKLAWIMTVARKISVSIFQVKVMGDHRVRIGETQILGLGGVIYDFMPFSSRTQKMVQNSFLWPKL